MIKSPKLVHANDNSIGGLSPTPPAIPHPLNCHRRSHAPERQRWAVRPGASCFATSADLEAANDNGEIEDRFSAPARIYSVNPPNRLTFNKSISTWAASSAKVRAYSEGSGPGELFTFITLATDTDIYAFRIEGARYDSGIDTYTFDYVALHVRHGLIFGEVKAHGSFFAHPPYASLMKRVASACDAIGAPFHHHTTAEILKSSDGDLYWYNVVSAFHWAETTILPSECDVVQDLLAGRDSLALAEIYEALAVDHRLALAKVRAMHCGRVLALDLDREIYSGAEVRAVLPPLHSIDINSFNLVIPT